MRGVTTHFKMSIDSIDAYHGGLDSCSGGNCYLDTNKPATITMLQRYEDLTHAHRIDTVPAPAGSPYWDTDESKMDAIRSAVVQKILTP